MTRDYAFAGSTADGDLLTADQLVTMTPFQKSTFAKWRQSWPNGRCKGPKPVRVEGRVFYRRSDVQDWLRTQTES